MSANSLAFEPIDPRHLKLPECPIPRPGDKVSWYAGSKFVTGELKGHDQKGRPLITNHLGNPTIKESFDDIRLFNPFDRRGPNWLYLPAAAKITQPPSQSRERFRLLLQRPIPPGPTSLDLAREIWNRGFEIYLVGGTVRDVLRGQDSNDVDLVTTMPLFRCGPLIRSMFRYQPSAQRSRGFIRIGGTPNSGDPFIDLKVFSDSLTGTEDATFGVGFDRDVAHRDFACNAVYFDPLNEVLIDPTGAGVDDSLNNRLTLICASGDQYQHAQVFLRFFKFCGRGFHPTPDTARVICTAYAEAIPVMRRTTRLEYVRAQVLNKCPTVSDRRPMLDHIGRLMTDFGVGAVWREHFEPFLEELCNGD